jgi:hypothetical protein
MATVESSIRTRAHSTAVGTAYRQLGGAGMKCDPLGASATMPGRVDWSPRTTVITEIFPRVETFRSWPSTPAAKDGNHHGEAGCRHGCPRLCALRALSSRRNSRSPSNGNGLELLTLLVRSSQVNRPWGSPVSIDQQLNVMAVSNCPLRSMEFHGRCYQRCYQKIGSYSLGQNSGRAR